MPSGISKVPSGVSIHTPTKGVTLHPSTSSQSVASFNPHTHEGCDTKAVPFIGDSLSFNPHTHEGCDLKKLNVKIKRYVSIHTPTKGVTFKILVLTVPVAVSIHTPTKGVTSFFSNFCLMSSGFNPHTHEGCDTGHLLQSSSLYPRFNPHTHEGCDRLSRTGRASFRCFNPHTHEGCDFSVSTKDNIINTFQSTHPRRV